MLLPAKGVSRRRRRRRHCCCSKIKTLFSNLTIDRLVSFVVILFLSFAVDDVSWPLAR